MAQKNNEQRYDALVSDIEVDVAIIGGGLAGIDTAYVLTSAGLRVAVLEATTVGSGATRATTAFLTQSIDTDPDDLIGMFGLPKTKQIYASHAKAIDVIESISAWEGIDCSFRRVPNYIFASSEGEFKNLIQSHKAFRKAGVPASLKKNSDLPFQTFGHLKMAKQAKYDAQAFLKGLAECTVEHGAHIYERTKVTNISGHKNIRIKANGYTVTAKHVIIATYDPLGNPKPTHYKKGMYMSYVFHLEIPKGALPEAIYEDMDNPYHYFRIDQGDKHDTMIIGGEDHRQELKMNPRKNFTALEQFVKKQFPGMKSTILSKWSGPILEPSDGLPLIGEFAPNQYVATAFSGNGMTYSMITALLLKDLILGKRNSWEKIYDPKRKPTAAQLTRKALDFGSIFVGGALKNFWR